MSDTITFPPDFLWGAATAAYQVEGAVHEDGRGESIWDRFSHTPGKIVNGDTGDVACDHYHRFQQDVKLMKELGIKAYRFSIAWPRIKPNGKGAVNSDGVDFYNRLIDTLLQNGIQPYATLYHWDLPQSMQDIGGWANRDVSGYFSDYAEVMAGRLGDRVVSWGTINEPWVIAFWGNREGYHAPGITDVKVTLQVAHNLLRGHGLATQAIRSVLSNPSVGIVLSQSPSEAINDSAKAQRNAEYNWRTDGALFVEALMKGHYPPEALEHYAGKFPEIRQGDMETISQKLDFLGINYYFRTVFDDRGEVKRVPGSEYTDMPWEVHAPALRRLLVRMNKDYDLPPVYITENGAAFPDFVSPDGMVHDPRRVSYIRTHLEQCRLAMEDGVDLRGYFVWSLLDNFEWAYGYSKRFGIVYVDYPVQERIIKDSGRWYSQMIKNGGSFLSEAAQGSKTLIR